MALVSGTFRISKSDSRRVGSFSVAVRVFARFRQFGQYSATQPKVRAYYRKRFRSNHYAIVFLAECVRQIHDVVDATDRSCYVGNLSKYIMPKSNKQNYPVVKYPKWGIYGLRIGDIAR